MAKVQTLEELKAENAKAEQELNATSAVAEDETQVEAVEETETEAEQVAEPEQEEESEDTTPAWMQTGDDTSDDDHSFSDSTAASIRRKWKGKLEKVEEEKNTEIESLRAEIEAMKGGAVKPQSTLSKPTLEQFDYDQDKYEEALVDYTQAKVLEKLDSNNRQSQQQAAQAAQMQQLEESVNSHYERAAKLADESGITPEQYQGSDVAVRKVVLSVAGFDDPQAANTVVDTLISKIGDGSEKVMYSLGVNKKQQAKFKAALEADPSGLMAGILLGEMKANLLQPVKKISKAKKPAAKAQGEGNQGSTSNWKRKYDKAKTTQERFDIRQQAKKAGENVREW